MENIIISNSEKFEEKKKKIFEKGANNFHVIADVLQNQMLFFY